MTSIKPPVKKEADEKFFRGAVITYRDRNNKTANAIPVSGVVVSNGLDVVKTDNEGKFILPASLKSNDFIFISTPSGYQPDSGFYQPINPKKKIDEYKFVLDPIENKNEFYFVQITDLHVTDKDKSNHLKECLAELAEVKPKPEFIVCTGDLISNANNPEEFPAFNEGAKEFPIPIRLLVGKIIIEKNKNNQ